MKQNALSLSFGILLASAISLVAVSARTWVDVTGKHKIEAEFVSLIDGKVTLKSPSGRITTLALEKLSVKDQSFAKARAGNPGVMKVTATAKIKKGPDHDTFRVWIDLIGGLAATAHSVGPFEVDPVSVGGKKIKPKKQPGRGRFKMIDRSKEGLFASHPKGGVRVKTEYEMPKGTERIGKVSGTVKVLAGGTTKEVVINNLLTRPEAAIKDPILLARELKVEFKRKTNEGGGLQIEAVMAGDLKGFVKLDLLGKDGKWIEESIMTFNATEKEMEYVFTAPKEALQFATLKLLFRDDEKEIEIPFTVESVNVTK